MSVQVHDNDIEPCLLVVLLILTVCFKCFECQPFLKYCISKRAFRIAILENMLKKSVTLVLTKTTA